MIGVLAADGSPFCETEWLVRALAQTAATQR
jgi:hypothetical protein